MSDIEEQFSYVADPATDLGSAGFGLMYYREASLWDGARNYDPALGRFTSADSIVPANQGVQAYDRFAYVSNNPIIHTDPSGNCFDENEYFCRKSADRAGNNGLRSCDSIVCNRPKSQEANLPISPLAPLPSSQTKPSGPSYKSSPKNYIVQYNQYYDATKVDWFDVAFDGAGVVVTLSDMACPETGWACPIAAGSNGVALVGAVYDTAKLQTTGDITKLGISTIFTESGLVRFVPVVGMAYSGIDAAYEINKGFYTIPVIIPVNSP